MASLTPAKGRWVDVDNGTRMYDPEVTPDIVAATPVPTRGLAAAAITEFTIPSQPGREQIGLVTPPPSQKKERPKLASHCLKAPYHDYDHKLKVPDSKDHKLPRVVFRWLVRSDSGAEKRLIKF